MEMEIDGELLIARGKNQRRESGLRWMELDVCVICTPVLEHDAVRPLYLSEIGTIKGKSFRAVYSIIVVVIKSAIFKQTLIRVREIIVSQAAARLRLTDAEVVGRPL